MQYVCDLSTYHVQILHWSGLNFLPSEWNPLPNIQLPGKCVIYRLSLQRGQHSPDVLICFDKGHCKIGQAFLTQVSLLFEQEQRKHGSSLSVTSRPSCTV